MTGGYSRRLAYWRLARRAHASATFQQKVLRKLAYDRDPLLTVMSDRIAVRDLVAERTDPSYLSTAHAIARSAAGIDWAALPREYALKANHGSGAMVLVWDGADATARLPADPASTGWQRLSVRPESADPDRLAALADHWLSLDYSWFPGKRTPEWGYESVPRGLIVEELLVDEHGALPDDYKFYVIHGRVHFILVVLGRIGSTQTHVYYDRDWTRIHPSFVSHGVVARHAGPDVPPPPAAAAELVTVAERLGSVTDAVRVDLYCLGSRIVFGELTPYQNAGEGHYEPAEFDAALARAWHQEY